MQDFERYLWNWTLAICAAILVFAAVFLSYPQIDIEVSRIFYVEGKRFPLNYDPRFKLLGKSFRWLFTSVFLLTFLILIKSLLAGNTAKIPRRIWVFCITSIILGPGILVNLILKNQWGRARPATIEQFGGQLTFSPPFYISDQCPTNCSFVSGEASSIATISVLACILLWTHIRVTAQATLLGTAIFITGLASALRVVKGRHFLSDTVFAVLFCALVIIFLYYLFDIHKARKRFSIANLKDDLRLKKPAA